MEKFWPRSPDTFDEDPLKKPWSSRDGCGGSLYSVDVVVKTHVPDVAFQHLSGGLRGLDTGHKWKASDFLRNAL